MNKKLYCLLAVFLVATVGVCSFVNEGTNDSDAGYIITGDQDYVATGETITLKVTNPTGEKVYCSWDLKNSSGESKNNGSFEVDVNNFFEVDVSAPSTAGDYKFVVKFYNNEDKADEHFVAEREMSVYVVEPITIKVTFSNSSKNAVTFRAHLEIKEGDQWKRVEGSEQDVKVSAYNPETETNGTGTYTFDYIVKNLDRTTTYRISPDSEIAKGIQGLEKEMHFYTSQNDYSFITWFLVIILIILIIVMIWIYRKPVKNFGKPKGRK